jgi:hypothetical protein
MYPPENPHSYSKYQETGMLLAVKTHFAEGLDLTLLLSTKTEKSLINMVYT